jgi:hypothetical protein
MGRAKATYAKRPQAMAHGSALLGRSAPSSVGAVQSPAPRGTAGRQCPSHKGRSHQPWQVSALGGNAGPTAGSPPALHVWGGREAAAKSEGVQSNPLKQLARMMGRGPRTQRGERGSASLWRHKRDQINQQSCRFDLPTPTTAL